MWLVIHRPQKPTEHNLRYENVAMFKSDITFFSDKPKTDMAIVLAEYKRLKQADDYWYRDSKLFYVEDIE